MIISFRDSETERIFDRRFSKKIPPEIQIIAFRKLLMIDNMKTLDSLQSPPGNHLEKLAGDRRGQYSIRINEKYRICFGWQDGNADNVEIVDYH